jgi:hypothetical protein
MWGVVDNLCAEINDDFIAEAATYRQGQRPFLKVENTRWIPLQIPCFYPDPLIFKKFFHPVDII